MNAVKAEKILRQKRIHTTLNGTVGLIRMLEAIAMRKQNKFTNKTEPKRFWKWTAKKTIGIVLFFIVLISFLYSATIKTIQNFQLNRRGLVIKAFVVDKQSIGGKGTINITLKYSVNGVTYQNDLTNEKWNVGDSVEIMYLTENPNIIRSRKFIRED